MVKQPGWDPEIVSDMTTEAIVEKMKELLPTFDLDTFVARTKDYTSSEDLSDEEYYPEATVSEEDEDFIWMACEELWKRLVPDRPAAEQVADQLEKLVDRVYSAREEGNWTRAARCRREALDLIWRHTVEETPAGPRLRGDFYEKLRRASDDDLDNLLDNAVADLVEQGKYQAAIDVVDVFNESIGDDVLLEHKAESLFALGKRDEGKQLYDEIISRQSDDPWFPTYAGDCYLAGDKKDFTQAKDYYLKALGIARGHAKEIEGKLELKVVYQRLIDLAHQTGDHAEAGRYERLMNSLQARKVGRNDPCPCGSGKKYKKCCGADGGAAPQPPPFDRRLMERDLLAIRQTVEREKPDTVEEMNKYLAEMNEADTVPEWMPETPLEKARELVFEALETTGKRRSELAKQALKISPDCADAYVLLAEEKMQSPTEAMKMYEAGVAAGERALGKEVFEEDAGGFWGTVETRPYMRARAGLANCLWAIGKREEAVSHYQEMLRLNPNDNQGIRYLLASSLLEMGKIDAMEELLGKYDEPTADWLFTRALVAYIKEGDSAGARDSLKEALERNPHVVHYLLGRKKLPRNLPDSVGLGDEAEAASYVVEFGDSWRKTRGAIAWLNSVAAGCGAWQSFEHLVGIPVFHSRLSRQAEEGTAGRELVPSRPGQPGGKLPVATVAYYGPDDQTPTKVAVGIVRQWDKEVAELKKWWGNRVDHDPVIQKEIAGFIRSRGARSVVITDGIIGCPHEEEIDFPTGEDCPYCHFWRGKQ